MAANVPSASIVLHRLAVVLDVTPVWWAERWALDAAEVTASLAKSAHLHAEAIDISPDGVRVHVRAVATTTALEIEQVRRRVWRELNDLPGPTIRTALVQMARALTRNQPDALTTGEVDPGKLPSAEGTNPHPRGLALFLAGATSAPLSGPGPVKARSVLWDPGRS
jgi:hypothetical protein